MFLENSKTRIATFASMSLSCQEGYRLLDDVPWLEQRMNAGESHQMGKSDKVRGSTVELLSFCLYKPGGV